MRLRKKLFIAAASIAAGVATGYASKHFRCHEPLQKQVELKKDVAKLEKDLDFVKGQLGDDLTDLAIRHDPGTMEKVFKDSMEAAGPVKDGYFSSQLIKEITKDDVVTNAASKIVMNHNRESWMLSTKIGAVRYEMLKTDLQIADQKSAAIRDGFIGGGLVIGIIAVAYAIGAIRRRWAEIISPWNLFLKNGVRKKAVARTEAVDATQAARVESAPEQYNGLRLIPASSIRTKRTPPAAKVEVKTPEEPEVPAWQMEEIEEIARCQKKLLILFTPMLKGYPIMAQKAAKIIAENLGEYTVDDMIAAPEMTSEILCNNWKYLTEPLQENGIEFGHLVHLLRQGSGKNGREAAKQIDIDSPRAREERRWRKIMLDLDNIKITRMKTSELSRRVTDLGFRIDDNTIYYGDDIVRRDNGMPVYFPRPKDSVQGAVIRDVKEGCIEYARKRLTALWTNEM
ncbi:MAG: hypothetical protein V1492_00850 [Candidatus Micrarchaeota archaeon]